jgi:hydrogenase expression/formation protein HypC
MCYAIPARIIKAQGDSGLVDYGGVRRKANLSLLENARVGAYVLVHAGFAIEFIDKEKAKESIRTLEEGAAKSEKSGR